ncbi:MAG: hypothetical protein ACMUHX_09605 [bacterium]
MPLVKARGVPSAIRKISGHPVKVFNPYFSTWISPPKAEKVQKIMEKDTFF